MADIQYARTALENLYGKSSSFTEMSDEELSLFTSIIREEIDRRENAGKVEQIRDIVPIEQWINSPYYIGEDYAQIYSYWKDLICDIFSNKRTKENNITQLILGGCFTGDTKVSLLSGEEISFRELELRYGIAGSYFWVYSCDNEGNIVPGKAHNVHKTKLATKIALVTLDNGEVIKCTPDHRFLLRDGSYKEAKDLKVNESLMPLHKNHKVVSVEIVSCNEWVYDLEVDDYHNFALSSGVFVHNSIGVGKSTAAELCTMRKLYELSCFKNINSMFHLMSKTNIMFFYFSINKTQAESTGFGELRSFIDHSPYFREHFRRRERLDSLLVFPEGITVAYGSRSSDSIGMSVICQILDEANFAGGNGSNSSGNAEKALDMYAGMINRANSRFIMDGGQNHSLNILVSSATHESSATERQIAMSKDDPHTIVAAPSQWEVKPDKFSKEYFYVLKGTNYLEPQIVESTDDINNFRLSENLKKEKFVDNLTDFESIEKEIQKLPPHMQERFLKVPVDLKRGFEMNIIRSLQDLGGVSTGTTGKLFNSPAVFDDCVDAKFHHPFTAQEIIISTGDRIEIKDYLRSDFRLRHPERKRYIHIDQSTTTDSTGISSVYVEDVQIDEETGLQKPIIGVDFVLRINPPKPPKKIAIYKIRNFVVYLGRTVGMNIGKVTYDIFNSEESRQILEEMGFNVAYLSVDRSDKQYLDMVEIMYEGRLKMYDYPILRHELFNLIHYRDKRKVDHPKVTKDSDYQGKGAGVGSKDTSDALCLSGDTQLFLLSGRKMSIEELYGSDFSDEWVLSCDIDNKEIVPVKIEDVIRKNVIPAELVSIELDSGDIVNVTEDHLILMRDGTYKRAGDVVEGDSLMPFTVGEAKTWKDYYRTVKSPFGGKPKNIYKLVAHTVLKDEWERVNSSIEYDDFVVTHHINHDKMDDRPSNLKPMSNKEHRKLHGDIFRAYNKSDKHKEDVKRSMRDGRNRGFDVVWENEEYANKVKEAGRRLLTDYNKSDKHKEDVKRAWEDGKYTKSVERFTEMARDKDIHKRALETKRLNGTLEKYSKIVASWNVDEEIKIKQKEGKVKKVYDLLKENTDYLDGDIVSVVDISFGLERLVDLGKVKKGYGVSYDPSIWKRVTGLSLYPCNVSNGSDLAHLKDLVLQAKNIYELVCDNVDGDWSKPTLKSLEEAYQILKSRGLVSKNSSFKKFKYEIFTLAHISLYNHTVVGVRRIKNSNYVYDLRLGSIHNFGISCGIFVHNCGAIAGLLQDTISDSVGNQNSLEEFLEANRLNTAFEPDAMNADEMIDKILEDTIEDMEMSYTGMTGFGYF